MDFLQVDWLLSGTGHCIAVREMPSSSSTSSSSNIWWNEPSLATGFPHIIAVILCVFAHQIWCQTRHRSHQNSPDEIRFVPLNIFCFCGFLWISFILDESSSWAREKRGKIGRHERRTKSTKIWENMRILWQKCMYAPTPIANTNERASNEGSWSQWREWEAEKSNLLAPNDGKSDDTVATVSWWKSWKYKKHSKFPSLDSCKYACTDVRYNIYNFHEFSHPFIIILLMFTYLFILFLIQFIYFHIVRSNLFTFCIFASAASEETTCYALVCLNAFAELKGNDVFVIHFEWVPLFQHLIEKISSLYWLLTE